MVIPIRGQDAVGIALRIIELAVPHGPDEGDKANSPQKQRNRYENAEDRHDYFSLRALSETVIEDKDIANAAARGVARPTKAIGTAMIL